jgi:hypothetical protein
VTIKCAAVALGVAVIIASAPSFAFAETVQVSPIRIDRVEIEQSNEVYNQFEPGLVSVTFTNTNAAAATDVVFDLLGYDGAIIAQYNDVGTFAQDQPVRQRFPDIHIHDNQQLEVDQVTFADGTSWSAHSSGPLPAVIFPQE